MRRVGEKGEEVFGVSDASLGPSCPEFECGVVPRPKPTSFAPSTRILDTSLFGAKRFNKTTMAAVQKVALITAGSAGLGAQIARTFAPDFRVVCLAQSSMPLKVDL